MCAEQPAWKKVALDAWWRRLEEKQAARQAAIARARRGMHGRAV